MQETRQQLIIGTYFKMTYTTQKDSTENKSEQDNTSLSRRINIFQIMLIFLSSYFMMKLESFNITIEEEFLLSPVEGLVKILLILILKVNLKLKRNFLNSLKLGTVIIRAIHSRFLLMLSNTCLVIFLQNLEMVQII